MNKLTLKLGTVDLLLEPIHQPAVKNARVLLFGRDHDGIGFFNRGKLGTVGRNDIASHVFLENVPEFFAVLGIRPEYEDRCRLDFPVSRFHRYRTCFQVVSLINNWFNRTTSLRRYLSIKPK